MRAIVKKWGGWETLMSVEHRLQDKSSTFKGPIDVVKQVVAKEGLLGAFSPHHFICAR